MCFEQPLLWLSPIFSLVGVHWRGKVAEHGIREAGISTGSSAKGRQRRTTSLSRMMNGRAKKSSAFLLDSSTPKRRVSSLLCPQNDPRSEPRVTRFVVGVHYMSFEEKTKWLLLASRPWRAPWWSRRGRCCSGPYPDDASTHPGNCRGDRDRYLLLWLWPLLHVVKHGRGGFEGGARYFVFFA